MFNFSNRIRCCEEFFKLENSLFKLNINKNTFLISFSLIKESTLTPFSISYSYSFLEQSTPTLVSFPIPDGINTDPLTICYPFLGLTPSLMHTSTDSLKVQKECNLISYKAWYGLYTSSLSSGVNIFYLFGILFWNRLGIFCFETAKVDPYTLLIRPPMVTLWLLNIDEIIVQLYQELIYEKLNCQKIDVTFKIYLKVTNLIIIIQNSK